jgi:hypothetical protein
MAIKIRYDTSLLAMAIGPWAFKVRKIMGTIPISA